MDARIKMAVGIVTRDFAGPIQEPDVAKAVNLSASRFGRRFRLETGQTFKAFLLRLRMTQARSIALLDPTLRIKEVSAIVGYKDRQESTFTRDFTKYWGYPLSRCRAMTV
jgi:transcriptional regulator GlxA family with amidase domain